MKLTLANKEALTVNESSTQLVIEVTFSTFSELDTIKQKLTDSNLESIDFSTDQDAVYAQYQNLHFTGEVQINTSTNIAKFILYALTTQEVILRDMQATIDSQGSAIAELATLIN